MECLAPPWPLGPVWVDGPFQRLLELPVGSGAWAEILWLRSDGCLGLSLLGTETFCIVRFLPVRSYRILLNWRAPLLGMPAPGSLFPGHRWYIFNLIVGFQCPDWWGWGMGAGKGKVKCKDLTSRSGVRMLFPSTTAPQTSVDPLLAQPAPLCNPQPLALEGARNPFV